MTTEELRTMVERDEAVTHWGREQRITPRLVEQVFGDGLQLLWLAPLNTRPNYYVVRIDSRWRFGDEMDDEQHGSNSDAFRDFVYEIEDAIEDQYGRHRDEDECPYCKDDPDGRCLFPVLHGDSGVAWGRYSVTPGNDQPAAPAPVCGT